MWRSITSAECREPRSFASSHRTMTLGACACQVEAPSSESPARDQVGVRPSFIGFRSIHSPSVRGVEVRQSQRLERLQEARPRQCSGNWLSQFPGSSLLANGKRVGSPGRCRRAACSWRPAASGRNWTREPRGRTVDSMSPSQSWSFGRRRTRAHDMHPGGRTSELSIASSIPSGGFHEGAGVPRSVHVDRELKDPQRLHRLPRTLIREAERLWTDSNRFVAE